MEIFSALLAFNAGNSPVNSPHKGQWHGALMFSLICAWINSWANTGEAGDLRRYCAHYDVIVMHFQEWRSRLDWFVHGRISILQLDRRLWMGGLVMLRKGNWKGLDTHYSNIAWPPWRLKSHSAWLLFQHLVQINNKANAGTHDYWPFVRGIHRSPLDSPYKGLILQKTFPHFHVMMSSCVFAIFKWVLPF